MLIGAKREYTGVEQNMEILKIIESPSIASQLGIHMLISVASFIGPYAWLLIADDDAIYFSRAYGINIGTLLNCSCFT